MLCQEGERAIHRAVHRVNIQEFLAATHAALFVLLRDSGNVNYYHLRPFSFCRWRSSGLSFAAWGSSAFALLGDQGGKQD